VAKTSEMLNLQKVLTVQIRRVDKFGSGRRQNWRRFFQKLRPHEFFFVTFKSNNQG